mgnify:CR=1 FL=1
MVHRSIRRRPTRSRLPTIPTTAEGRTTDVAFRLAYHVAPHLHLEAFAGANNARDFASRTSQLRLKLDLSQMPAGTHLPVKPIPDWKRQPSRPVRLTSVSGVTLAVRPHRHRRHCEATQGGVDGDPHETLCALRRRLHDRVLARPGGGRTGMSRRGSGRTPPPRPTMVEARSARRWDTWVPAFSGSKPTSATRRSSSDRRTSSGTSGHHGDGQRHSRNPDRRRRRGRHPPVRVGAGSA